MKTAPVDGQAATFGRHQAPVTSSEDACSFSTGQIFLSYASSSANSSANRGRLQRLRVHRQGKEASAELRFSGAESSEV